MLQIIVVQLEFLQIRFYFSKAGWVRGICCYVAGVKIDFYGFEHEFRYMIILLRLYFKKKLSISMYLNSDML